MSWSRPTKYLIDNLRNLRSNLLDSPRHGHIVFSQEWVLSTVTVFYDVILCIKTNT